MAQQTFRITYATMKADNEDLQAAYDRGIETAKSWLGEEHPYHVNGEARKGESWFEERSPIDHDMVIGRFAQASREDVKEAIAGAKAAYPQWAGTPWKERVDLLRRAADLISERNFELSALLAIEVGKNRLEALGDVAESADLIRYYCDQMEENEGFEVPMDALSPQEHNRSVMKPYGVWAVISPFNFPMALAAGPMGGALVAGNTVVFKPSSAGVFTGLKLYEVFRDAGLPTGVVHFVPGPGPVVGDELANNPDVDGMTFTGSYEVGMDIYKNFAKEFPKPVICEMGGKNPAIVTSKADLDKAAEGVLRSAFGYQGQKCSATSRVYVERPVFEDFVRVLKDKVEGLRIGNPLERDVFMGPVINERSVETFEEAAAEAQKNGQVVTGGERIDEGELARGNFVKPTVVEVPLDSWIWKRELFVPFVAVGPVDSLDQALELANDTEYGLTAGIFTEDDGEKQKFLDRIEAGVVYVNRRAGATTGAWPGMQPFGGWKGSGTGGKAGGGHYYVQQYLREQSQTVIEE
ncbi:MAG: aldehyde dehydrogenase family protein [Actinomycetota bacterium]